MKPALSSYVFNCIQLVQAPTLGPPAGAAAAAAAGGAAGPAGGGGAGGASVLGAASFCFWGASGAAAAGAAGRGVPAGAALHAAPISLSQSFRSVVGTVSAVRLGVCKRLCGRCDGAYPTLLGKGSLRLWLKWGDQFLAQKHFLLTQLPAKTNLVLEGEASAHNSIPSAHLFGA